MNRTVIDLIKSRFSVLEVAEELGMEVDALGKTWAIDRPESEPSIQLYEDHWHDFGSGEHGDVLDLVARWYGTDLRGALRWFKMDPEDWTERPVVRKTNKEEPKDFAPHLPAYNPGLVWNYWSALLPSASTVELFGLRTYTDTRELVIPHWYEGRVEAVKVRHKNGSKTSWSGSQFNYLYERAGGVKVPNDLVIVEGESDTWWADAAFAEDMTVAVCGLPSGANHWKDEWSKTLLENFPLGSGQGGAHIWLCFDNDQAGHDARYAIQKKLKYQSSNLWVPEQYNDVREALQDGWRMKRCLDQLRRKA